MFQMLPHEVAAVVAGTALPLAALWGVLLVLRPNRDLTYHTEALRRQLALLTFPADEAEHRVQVVSDVLRRQTEELNHASDQGVPAIEGDLGPGAGKLGPFIRGVEPGVGRNCRHAKRPIGTGQRIVRIGRSV